MNNLRIVVTYSMNGQTHQTTDYAEVTDERLQVLREPNGSALIDFLEPFYHAMWEEELMVWQSTQVDIVSTNPPQRLVRFS